MRGKLRGRRETRQSGSPPGVGNKRALSTCQTPSSTTTRTSTSEPAARLILRFRVAPGDLRLVLGVIGDEIFAELGKGSGVEGRSHLRHQVQIKVQVMHGDEP